MSDQYDIRALLSYGGVQGSGFYNRVWKQTIAAGIRRALFWVLGR